MNPAHLQARFSPARSKTTTGGKSSEDAHSGKDLFRNRSTSTTVPESALLLRGSTPRRAAAFRSPIPTTINTISTSGTQRVNCWLRTASRSTRRKSTRRWKAEPSTEGAASSPTSSYRSIRLAPPISTSRATKKPPKCGSRPRHSTDTRTRWGTLTIMPRSCRCWTE